MIYQVIKDGLILSVDDNIFFDKQPKEFKKMFEELQVNNSVDFDNCNVLKVNNRVVITVNTEENEPV